MTYRVLVFFGALAAGVAFTSAPLAGQIPQGTTSNRPAAQPAPLRTPWGDPDVQGMWIPKIRVPFQRPRNETREFLTDAEVAAKEKAANAREAATQQLIARGEYIAIGDRYFPNDPGVFRDAGVGGDAKVSKRTSAVIDPPSGRLPPWTRAQMKRWEAREEAARGRGEADSWEDRGIGERCLTSLSSAYAPAVQVPQLALGEKFASGSATSKDSDNDVSSPIRRLMQFPGYVVITTLDIQHAGEGPYRIVPLDGRPKLGPAIRQWQGDSRGHWEGDTLVVEIENINGYQNGGPIPSAEAGNDMYPASGETLRVVERYRRTDADTLEFKITIEDPETYIRPFTVMRELSRDDTYEMQPFSCHEMHRSIAGALAQARADEASAVEYGMDSQKERFEKYELLKKEWAELWPEWRDSAR